MATRNKTSSFKFDQQGLFSRKSSTNILSDPRILEHLRTVAEEAQKSEEDENDEEDEYEFQRRELSEKICSYNKRNQLGAFRVIQKDLDYEGAIRFYYEDGNQELTKAIKLTNKTTVDELLPLLIEKFNLVSSGQYALYIVHEKDTKLDEIFLFDSDCPLTIAINALRVPHFVLRKKLKNGHQRDSTGSYHERDDVYNDNNGDVTPEAQQKTALKFVSAQSFDETKYKSKKLSDTSSTSSLNTELSKSGTRHPRSLSDCSSEKHVSISPQLSDLHVFAEEEVEAKETKKKKVARSKSIKAVASMLKRKKTPKETRNPIELSTHQIAPGILKVFGDHVSPGSNYKSVRASTISTSQELVRQALEKYGILENDPGEYVLCDVVGHFKTPLPQDNVGEDEHVWITEYVRVIHDYEKPLVLQSLWKPSGNRLRRFELRKREEVETSGFYINTAETSDRNSSYSVGSDSEQSSTVSGADSSNNISPETRGKIHKDHTDSGRYHGAALNRATSNTSAETYPVPPDKADLHQPSNVPFLLLLNGYDVDFDLLYFCLDEQVSVIGNSECPAPKSKPDLGLCAPDILGHHAFVYKKVSIEENAMETNLDEIRFLVYIEPMEDALLKINNRVILERTLVEPGDLILFGNYYIFMFKDPTQIASKGVSLAWLTKVDNLGSVESKESQTETLSNGIDKAQIPSIESVEYSHTSSIEVSDNKEVEARFEKNIVGLTYTVADEDYLLDVIMGVMDNETSVFKLTPAYILVMVIEHSAAYFSGLQTRKLLLKISSALQSVAWEKTKEIGKNMTDLGSNGITMLDGVIQEIKPVIFWMANALEMMHFLQCNLSTYLSYQEPMAGSQESLDAADEELLTVLEEIIMFTFQQTVYHLTKVLYSALPAVLDTNPFQAEEGSSDDEGTPKNPPPAVALVLSIFERTRQVAETFMVHSQIIGQLFAYLFFFSNASLFNSLMERGAGGKFYKWTKGVQIRGNLEFMEEWATQASLAEEFAQYMKKLVAAVDILSTPKVQLMQISWSLLREEYSDLNPAQLQQLLGEYQLGGKPKPKGWFPPPEEVELALKTSEVLESFATHPPLLLPTTGFHMDLSVEPNDPVFKSFVERLNSNFGTNGKGSESQETCESPRFTDFPPVENTKVVHSQVQRVVSTEIPRRGSPTEQFEALGMRLERLGSSGQSRFRPTPKTNDNAKKSAPKQDAYRVGTPVPQKKGDMSIEHRISLDSSSDRANSDEDKEEALTTSAATRKVAVLGDPKSIQISPRKASRKEEITVKIAPRAPLTEDDDKKSENVVGNAKPRSGSRVMINGHPVESSNDARDDYYDDSILTESDLDSYSNDEEDVADLNDFDDTFVVELKREKTGLGLGLIDGMFTPLETPGIFIRTILPTGPAAKDGRIRIGDRILSVNGKSLVGADYASAMELIRSGGEKLSFTLSRSDKVTISKITASAC